MYSEVKYHVESRRMKKSPEQEQQLKLAIRDEVAHNPLISVLQLQSALKARGFPSARRCSDTAFGEASSAL
jgi:hypothetical protein